MSSNVTDQGTASPAYGIPWMMDKWAKWAFEREADSVDESVVCFTILVSVRLTSLSS